MCRVPRCPTAGRREPAGARHAAEGPEAELGGRARLLHRGRDLGAARWGSFVRPSPVRPNQLVVRIEDRITLRPGSPSNKESMSREPALRLERATPAPQGAAPSRKAVGETLGLRGDRCHASRRSATSVRLRDRNRVSSITLRKANLANCRSMTRPPGADHQPTRNNRSALPQAEKRLS